MPELLVQRARLLTGIAWAVALITWVGLWHLGGKLDYWIFCWPADARSSLWDSKRTVVQVAKVANAILPIAASLALMRYPQTARQVAFAAILTSILLIVGLTIWVGSFYSF